MVNGVLDLASGTGRNGKFLLQHNIPVTFADNNAASLAEIQRDPLAQSAAATIWEVDLEENTEQPLAGRAFDAVLVFNYLHRPLFPQLRAAIRSGGLIIYETFTEAQRAHGRPRNPDFLLRSGELAAEFSGWQVLHEFEGELSDPPRAKASIVARKP